MRPQPLDSRRAPLEGQRTLERRAICGIGVRREHDVDRQVEQRAQAVNHFLGGDTLPGPLAMHL